MSKLIGYIISVLLVCSVIFCGCGKADSKGNNEPNKDTAKNEETTTNQQPDKDTESETEETLDTQPPETEEVVIIPEPEPTPLGYVAPEGWYTPVYTTGKVDGGEYNLTYGVMGLKVYMVQKRLNLLPASWGYYWSYTINSVKRFQSQNGMEVTGVVDLNTWLKMGFTESDWYEAGAYVAPVRPSREFSSEKIIDEFLKQAEEYLGTTYVVGASGKPGEGVDCSGLVLQCLYSIGIYPDGLDPVQHSTIEEFNSRLMWADPKFKEVKQSELKKGDLVFYSAARGGTVCHIAIYMGDGKCIEALYKKVEILPLVKDNSGYYIVGCKRVIDN